MGKNIKRIFSTISVRVFYPASSLSIILLVYAANNICCLTKYLPNIQKSNIDLINSKCPNSGTRPNLICMELLIPLPAIIQIV